MALKALMLRKQLDNKKKALEELCAKDADYERREAELEQAIEEANTQEEQDTVTEEVEAFTEERDEHEKAKNDLQSEIDGIEHELESIENENLPVNSPAEGRKERKKEYHMENRTKFFGMTAEQRNAFISHPDVRDFLERVRALGKEKRAVTGAELLIPEVVLDLVRENIQNYSKLIGRVNCRSVPGTTRQNVMGTIPEAIWTEMTGKLNEVGLLFNEIETDGYKVAAFIPVANTYLEDSDIALAQEIITALGQGVGYALDKAIMYGTGTKMPLGIVTRLAQIEKPAEYPKNAREWKDLSTTNITQLDVTAGGIELFQGIVRASAEAKSEYAHGEFMWIMSHKTRMELIAQSMSINASGAIVAGVNGTMPVIGGDIIELNFVPDGDIVGGYGDLYSLSERAGTSIGQSEHVRFLEDQTVFAAKARYDGTPVIAEAFVLLNIMGMAPKTTTTFAHDTANAG